LIAELERKVGHSSLRLDFLSRSLAAVQGPTPGNVGAWRSGIYNTVILVRDAAARHVGIERMVPWLG